MKFKTLIVAVGLIAVAVVVVIVLRTGKHEGPEPIEHGRDACARCHMKIDRPGFGGEFRDKDGVLTKYDDIGCMLVAMWAKHQEIPEAYVEDNASGELIPLLAANLVRGQTIETPMAYGILAFKTPEAAKEFAGVKNGEVITLDQLIVDTAWFQAREKSGAQGAGHEGHGGHEEHGSAAPAQTAAAVPGGPRPITEANAKAGKDIYVRECMACHGERGDGDGVAAAFLDVKPRDFLLGNFRIRTTPQSDPPATADILRTIERGIPGTAMPSFKFLTEDERKNLAAFVLEKAEMLETPEPKPVDLPAQPPATTQESIDRGKALYVDLKCETCHGVKGKGDGPASKTLKDDKERPMKARDFVKGDYRGGSERTDLYYRLMTGMGGTPMPAYGDSMPESDRWALIDYMLSLRAPEVPVTYPADPIKAGRMVTAKYSCRGCHMLDDGKGGDVGPDLRIAGQKLEPDWVRNFVKDPRAKGKIYPWRTARMPHLGVNDAEADVIAKYLAAMGKRKDAPVAIPDTNQFDAAKVEEGKNLYVLRCTECHNLGAVVPTPAIKWQGPDLIKVGGRVNYEWEKNWILDPKKIDPKTRMTVPGVTPEQADSIRMFVWKSSLDSQKADSATPK